MTLFNFFICFKELDTFNKPDSFFSPLFIQNLVSTTSVNPSFSQYCSIYLQFLITPRYVHSSYSHLWIKPICCTLVQSMYVPRLRTRFLYRKLIDHIQPMSLDFSYCLQHMVFNTQASRLDTIILFPAIKMTLSFCLQKRRKFKHIRTPCHF